jgi:hypothetical protein
VCDAMVASKRREEGGEGVVCLEETWELWLVERRGQSKVQANDTLRLSTAPAKKTSAFASALVTADLLP